MKGGKPTGAVHLRLWGRAQKCGSPRVLSGLEVSECPGRSGSPLREPKQVSLHHLSSPSRPPPEVARVCG